MLIDITDTNEMNSSTVYLLLFLLLYMPTICLCQCLAPPFWYGPVCNTGPPITGDPGHRVHYRVLVARNIDGSPTVVCCRGRACGGRLSSICRSRGWYLVGCTSSGAISGTLLWGNTPGQPAVKCKGTPNWSWYWASS